VNWDDVVATEAEDDGVAQFTARYTSQCPCGNTIDEGDWAGYLPGEDTASCAECCGLT